MAELSNSYIKGFVETCFKAGVHEKQAAAMLKIAAEQATEMIKEAGPSVGKGLWQVLSGLGNIGGGLVVGGKGLGTVAKLPFKGIKAYHNYVLAPGVRRAMKDKNHLAALLHAGVFGGAPLVAGGAGLAALQNWRNYSNSELADEVNAVLGKPEMLVFDGFKPSSDYVPTNTYNPSSYSRRGPIDSPLNIPGTSNYSSPYSGSIAPLSSVTGGAAARRNGAVPENIRGLVDEYANVDKSIANLQNSYNRSSSSTARRRGGGDAMRELLERKEEITSAINDGIDTHNRQVALNNESRANAIADARKELADVQRWDIAAADNGIDNPEYAVERWFNDGLEAIGYRDSDTEAIQRGSQIDAARNRVQELERSRPEAELDPKAVWDTINKSR